MFNKQLLLLWPASFLASLTIDDPFNVFNPIFWKLDDVLVADHDIAFASVQPEVTVTTIEDKCVTASHTSYSTKTTDASALLITNGATLHMIPRRHLKNQILNQPNLDKFLLPQRHHQRGMSSYPPAILNSRLLMAIW
ncbi:unnamed protein product [Penicillium palitans]